MSISTRPDEPAVRRYRPRPTEAPLPWEESRPPAGGYALAIAAAVAIGLALLAMGSVRLTQSARILDRSGDVTQIADVLPDASQSVAER